MQPDRSIFRTTNIPWRSTGIIVIAAALLFLLAWLAFPYDKLISDWFRAWEIKLGGQHALQEFLQMMRPLGKSDVLMLGALLLGIAGFRRWPVQIAAALIFVTIVVSPVKLIVGRERPGIRNNQSFPSGDTASITAVCVPLVYSHPALLPVAIGAVVTVAGGRVFDGKHYPSDVLAGAACGLLAGAVALRLAGFFALFRPRRSWMIAAALIVLAGQAFMWMILYRTAPGVFSFMRAWGPGIVMVLAGLFIPVILRRNRGRLQTMMAGAGRRTMMVVIMLAMAWVLLAFISTRSTLWDRDEPRFAKATLEMVESGNYLVPTFNGTLRPDKPILIYWLMSVPVKILGATELACRFWAPLGIVFAGLIMFVVGRRFFSFGTAFMALVFMITTPMVLISGTAATTDAVLLACITAAVASFAFSMHKGARAVHLAGLALVLALALLVKGPIGLALPLLAMGLMYVLAGNERRIGRRYFAWAGLAVAVAVALFLLWGIPANDATGGIFMQKAIGTHVIGRMRAPMERHGGNYIVFLPYYLVIITATFFPWTLYLPAGLAALWRNRTGVLASRALVLGWAIPVIVLMTLVATKLPHYILPAWPALALAVAAVIPRRDQPGGDVTALPGMRLGMWLFMIVGVGLAVGMMFIPWFLPMPGLRVPLFSLGLATLVLSLKGRSLCVRGRHLASAAFLTGGMIVFMLTLAVAVLPPLEAYKVSAPIARAINAASLRDVPVVVYKFDEPSFHFYLNRAPIRVLPDHSAIARWAREPAAGMLVIPRKDADVVDKAFGPLPLKILFATAGYNYSNGRAVDLVVLERRPPAP